MYSSNGPVIFIEDDADDHEFMVEAFKSLNLKNAYKIFAKAQDAIDYLLTTTDKPFIIISEVTLRGMDGIRFRKKMLSNAYLRKKSIPFVFFTTNHDCADVEAAYDLEVQGYFIKQYNVPETGRMMQKIFDYWAECFHPNNCR